MVPQTDPLVIRWNHLHYGDNLDVLQRKIASRSGDLCYIDPPFNAKRTYLQIYDNQGGEHRAQEQAFVDTWEWGEEAAEGLDHILDIERLQGGTFEGSGRGAGHRPGAACRHHKGRVPRLREGGVPRTPPGEGAAIGADRPHGFPHVAGLAQSGEEALVLQRADAGGSLRHDGSRRTREPHQMSRAILPCKWAMRRHAAAARETSPRSIGIMRVPAIPNQL